jgi:hypothetical protein
MFDLSNRNTDSVLRYCAEGVLYSIYRSIGVLIPFEALEGDLTSKADGRSGIPEDFNGRLGQTRFSSGGEKQVDEQHVLHG